MPQSPGVVRVRCRGEATSLEVQVEGWGTMHHSPAMRQWVEANLPQAPRLRVDLSRCTHMDSTFIGTLLGLKRLTESLPGGGIALVCPSAECLQVLAQLRIGRIFTIESEPSEESDWQEVCLDPDGMKSRGFRTTVVEAHQQLADCEGPAGHHFRALAEAMARELERD
jgi:anti-anti-sigma factor